MKIISTPKGDFEEVVNQYHAPLLAIGDILEGDTSWRPEFFNDKGELFVAQSTMVIDTDTGNGISPYTLMHMDPQVRNLAPKNRATVIDYDGHKPDSRQYDGDPPTVHENAVDDSAKQQKLVQSLEEKGIVLPGTRFWVQKTQSEGGGDSYMQDEDTQEWTDPIYKVTAVELDEAFRVKAKGATIKFSQAGGLSVIHNVRRLGHMHVMTGGERVIVLRP